MGMFDALTEFLTGPIEVEMPATVSDETIAKGVELVKTAIAEKERREKEWRRAEAERQARYSPAARFHTRLNIPPPMADDVHVPQWGMWKRIPPDLNAKELSFSAMVVKYVRERCDGKAPVAYKRAGIDRKLYSKIVSDNFTTVSKQTALRLAIGLQLNRSETDEFLHAAGYALSSTIPYDCVFAYCIENAIWNIMDVNRIFIGAGFPGLTVY